MSKFIRAHDTSYLDDKFNKKKSSKKRIIPRQVIRSINMNSNERGKIHCEYCHHSFSANYVKSILINFTDKRACRDCLERKNLKSYIID